MTVHVSGRSISALLLLSVNLVGLPADVESTEMGGRTIFQVERVEVGGEHRHREVGGRSSDFKDLTVTTNCISIPIHLYFAEQ
jgi:hypothetical protein